MPTDRPGEHLTLQLSVLDRLAEDPELDRIFGYDDPKDTTRRAAVRREQQRVDFDKLLRLGKDSVRRDLQDLLNSRLVWVDDDLRACQEASRSIATFGLPDFTHENLENVDARERVRFAIEQAILRFEPRLVDLRVTPEPPKAHARSLLFKIEAVLRLDPIREPVTFDTVLQATGVAEVTDG